jgi:hypothetical protein
MNPTEIILSAILFAVYIPGVIFTLPPRAAFREQVILHSIVFAVAYYTLHRYVLPFFEGFANPSTKVNPVCPKRYKQLPSGDCVLETDIHGRNA